MKRYRIYKDIFDDIGWDEYYYQEGYWEKTNGSYINKKDATLYTLEEAENKVKELNDIWYTGEYDNETFKYEEIKE
jgi:hypothetical protein